MKTKNYLVLLGLITSLSTSAHPVVKLTKSCGGIFGYQYTSKELVQFEGTPSNLGWVIECSGRGFANCPNAGHSLVLNNNITDNLADGYDLAVGDDLILMAESNISNGITNGSSTITKQVDGQNFARVYRVNWSSSPTTCNDESGNPFNVTINVDVEYVII